MTRKQFKPVRSKMLNGVRTVELVRDDGSKVVRAVAEVVLEAFVGDRPSPEYVPIHLDGDATNCRASNLKWGRK